MSSTCRKGRQTPTVSVVLPYTESHGGEALALYNRTGRTAQEWQERMIEDIMAVNADGLWVHMKFAWRAEPAFMRAPSHLADENSDVTR